MNRGFDEGVEYKDGYERTVQCLYQRVEGGTVGTPVHYHDYVEILYGIHCDMTAWINDEIMRFCSGDVIIINPREAHFLKADSDYASEYIVIKFSVPFLKYDGQMPPEMRYFAPLTKSSVGRGNIIKRGEMDDEYIKTAVTGIYNEWCEEKFGYEIAIRSGLLNLYLQMIRYWKDKNENAKLFDNESEIASRIYMAAEYVSSNYADATVEEAAKKCMMSYSYFSRCFKKVMGMGFSQYLNDVRLDNAKIFLLTSDKSITDIAVNTGFSSSSHFIYAFKKKTGMSPLGYKKEFKQKYEN